MCSKAYRILTQYKKVKIKLHQCESKNANLLEHISSYKLLGKKNKLVLCNSIKTMKLKSEPINTSKW